MKRKKTFSLVAALLMVLFAGLVHAQGNQLRFATVERPPFSSLHDGEFQGFSIELMEEIAASMGASVQFEQSQTFGDMLHKVETAQIDGAIANISITRSREALMDFSQPMFRSGLQILVPGQRAQPNIWTSALSWELAGAVLIAFGILFGGGMLMWVFERAKQPYFDRPAREAMFPSFWWALNLVVNGGFEERMPRSFLGRIFGVFLVISSLFVVSVFVAHITATTTVKAISGSVSTIADLDGQRVGTTTASTSSDFLTGLGISHLTYSALDDLFSTFERGELDAIVFDGPLLAYYANHRGAGLSELLPHVYRPENYGIALPAESALREPINVALLQLHESGRYDEIYRRWFGNN